MGIIAQRMHSSGPACQSHAAKLPHPMVVSSGGRFDAHQAATSTTPYLLVRTCPCVQWQCSTCMLNFDQLGLEPCEAYLKACVPNMPPTYVELPPNSHQTPWHPRSHGRGLQEDVQPAAHGVWLLESHAPSCTSHCFFIYLTRGSPPRVLHVRAPGSASARLGQHRTSLANQRMYVECCKDVVGLHVPAKPLWGARRLFSSRRFASKNRVRQIPRLGDPPSCFLSCDSMSSCDWTCSLFTGRDIFSSGCEEAVP